MPRSAAAIFFFCNATATTKIYTLSLHDALPIARAPAQRHRRRVDGPRDLERRAERLHESGRARAGAPHRAHERQRPQALQAREVEVRVAVALPRATAEAERRRPVESRDVDAARD